MKNRQNKRKADAVLVLLLLGVFAVCILSVLLTGAETYSRLAERDQQSYHARTAARYLTTKVRQADRAGAVSVRSFGGHPALILTEEIGGTEYETRIYYHDGCIRELFAAAEGEFLPSDGEKVLPAGDLLIEEGAEGLHIRIRTEDDRWQELYLHLRSGEEALP